MNVGAVSIGADSVLVALWGNGTGLLP